MLLSRPLPCRTHLWFPEVMLCLDTVRLPGSYQRPWHSSWRRGATCSRLQAQDSGLCRYQECTLFSHISGHSLLPHSDPIVLAINASSVQGTAMCLLLTCWLRAGNPGELGRHRGAVCFYWGWLEVWVPFLTVPPEGYACRLEQKVHWWRGRRGGGGVRTPNVSRSLTETKAQGGKRHCFQFQLPSSVFF